MSDASAPSTGDHDRIHRYRDAVQAMRHGDFDVDLGPHQEDALGRLGEELEALARRLDQWFRETTGIRKISERIEAGFFLPEVLDAVYDGFRDLIPYDRIGCALVDRTGDPSEWKVVAKWARTDYGSVRVGPGYEERLAGSSLEEILETGRPRILNDLEAYLEENPESDATRRIVAEGVRSSLTCPLVAHGIPVGFLFFSSREPNAYRDLHHEIFLGIARQLSLVVEKSLLLERLFTLTHDLRQAREKLEYRATHDPLTGILNRGALQARLQEEVTRGLRHQTPVGVVLLDLDRFKEVNDRHGHEAGDEVLKALARVLDEESRGFEAVGRWGGEEFLLVLSDDASEEGVRKAASRIRQRMEGLEVEHATGAIQVTVSAGGASGVPPDARFADDLVRAADDALYRAKSEGRNRVAYVAPSREET